MWLLFILIPTWVLCWYQWSEIYLLKTQRHALAVQHGQILYQALFDLRNAVIRDASIPLNNSIIVAIDHADHALEAHDNHLEKTEDMS